MLATCASTALSALVMAEFMEALVGWLASRRLTEAGVLLEFTSSCSASSALWFAFPASPVVRLVLRVVMEGSDEALGGCQIGSQRIGCEVRRRWDGGHLGLQCRDGGRVGSDGGGVGCGVGQGGVGRQNRGQLPCGDALHLDGGAWGLAIVEDVPGDGGLKKTHVLLTINRGSTRPPSSKYRADTTACAQNTGPRGPLPCC